MIANPRAQANASAHGTDIPPDPGDDPPDPPPNDRAALDRPDQYALQTDKSGSIGTIISAPEVNSECKNIGDNTKIHDTTPANNCEYCGRFGTSLTSAHATMYRPRTIVGGILPTSLSLNLACPILAIASHGWSTIARTTRGLDNKKSLPELSLNPACPPLAIALNGESTTAACTSRLDNNKANTDDDDTTATVIQTSRQLLHNTITISNTKYAISMQRPVDNNATSNQHGSNQHGTFEYTAQHKMPIDGCLPANREDLKKRNREGDNIANLFSLIGAWLTPAAPAAGKGP